MKQARADRYRREHAEYMARMRKATARPHAPRRTRIRLAVGLLVAIVGVGAVQLLVDGLWGLAALLGAMAATVALWLTLRRATSLVTEAPDDVLDELHIRLRNVYFRDAYRILVILVAVVLFALLLLSSTVPVLAEDIGGVLVFPVLVTASALPTIVAAFRMPDVDAGD